jgi:hypothetical protein
MGPAYLALDTPDDRRELYLLLARLPPAARLDFLRWCCGRVTTAPGETPPEVLRSTRGETQEVWRDLLFLTVQYDLDLGAAGLELVRRVRRHGGRLDGRAPSFSAATGGAVMLGTAPPAPARPPRPRPA